MALNQTMKIFLLGSFRLEITGQIVTSDSWKSKKALSLFEYLVSKYDEKVAKDVLIELLWPESSKDQTHNLHSTIYFLRSTINFFLEPGEDCPVHFARGFYWFEKNQSVWIDIVEFENLCQTGSQLRSEDPGQALHLFEDALGLYQGGFLSDELYNDWTISPRQYYLELYINTVLQASQLMLDYKSDPQEALHLCREALEIYPFREELYQRIIATQIKMGHLLEAQKIYQRYALMIREEFGLEPSPRIQELFVGAGDQTEQNNMKSKKGSLMIDRSTFATIFDLQLRRQKRNRESFALIGIKLDEQVIQDVSLELLEQFRRSLRQGDVVCLWKEGEILIMLLQVGKKETEVITRRLKQVIPERLSSEHVQLKYKLIEHGNQGVFNSVLDDVI